MLIIKTGRKRNFITEFHKVLFTELHRVLLKDCREILS